MATDRLNVTLAARQPLRGILEAHLSQYPAFALTPADEGAPLVRAVAGADAVVMPMYYFTPELGDAMRAAPRLRLVQLLNAGYDKLAGQTFPPTVSVATAGGSLATAVADHAMALLLSLYRCLPEARAIQLGRKWDRSTYEKSRTLTGATAVVYGFGAIGSCVAARLGGFGVTVIGVNRSGGSHPLAAELVGPAGLDAALARADIVVITAELTGETRGAFDAARIARIKPGARLVNVSRGAIVDTAALLAALESGHLAGAGLDVTDPEPLPAEHPLWTAPNTVITPHVAGGGSAAQVVAFARANLERLMAGQPLESVVRL